MTLLFKLDPKYNAEVLSSIPKCKKAVACLMEKITGLDKLHSGMSYGDVGCEFSSMLMDQWGVSLNRNTHKIRLYFD